MADVSFLVGLLIEKFQYHLPLCRQHQRLSAAGVTLSRATLTNLVRRAITLLEPIVDAQRTSVLQSRVLAMDETPTKAGKSKKTKGQMHQGYYWPIYGDRDEIVFTYSDSRAQRVIEQILNDQFKSVLTLGTVHQSLGLLAQSNNSVTSVLGKPRGSTGHQPFGKSFKGYTDG